MDIQKLFKGTMKTESVFSFDFIFIKLLLICLNKYVLLTWQELSSSLQKLVRELHGLYDVHKDKMTVKRLCPVKNSLVFFMCKSVPVFIMLLMLCRAGQPAELLKVGTIGIFKSEVTFNWKREDNRWHFPFCTQNVNLPNIPNRSFPSSVWTYGYTYQAIAATHFKWGRPILIETSGFITPGNTCMKLHLCWKSFNRLW